MCEPPLTKYNSGAILFVLLRFMMRQCVNMGLSCVYTSAEKSTEFKLIMLVRVPLYSQTETR